MHLRAQHLTRSSLLSGLALVSSPALAQPEIVVTGRALPDPAADRALAVQTIARDRLTTTASGRLEDALRDVAGVQQFRRSDARSANPTSQGATLRGLGGNAAGRLLVLLDGVPQNDPFAGYVSWPSYVPERLGRVRVLRGVGGVAGTLAIDSVAAGEAPQVSAALAGGSFGAFEGRGLVSGRLGGGFGLIAGGYARGDGFVPIVTPGPVDRGARYDQWSLAARAVAPIGAGEIQVSLSIFDDIRTRGTAFSRNQTTGGDASLRFVGRQVELLGYLQLRRFASQFASVDAARTVVTPTLDQFNTPATGMGAKGEYRPLAGPIDVRVGGEWRRTQGATNELFLFVSGAPTRLRTAGGSSDIVGGFAELTRNPGTLTLTARGQVDRWWLSDGRLSERALAGGAEALSRFPRRQGWEPSGRIGAALDVLPTLTIRAAAYADWRLPTLNELYRPFRVGAEVTQANAALSPERSRGIEGGFGWRPLDGLTIDATVFAVRLDDAIANVTLSSTPALVTRQRRNLARIDSRGVEVDAAYRRGDWRLVASAAYADARTSDGLRPASFAPFQASGSIGWRGLSATLRYTSAQFDDDLNTRRLASALTVDAVADVAIASGVSAYARIENAFDARVEAARSAAGVVERAGPRSLWIGIRFER